MKILEKLQEMFAKGPKELIEDPIKKDFPCNILRSDKKDDFLARMDRFRDHHGILRSSVRAVAHRRRSFAARAVRHLGRQVDGSRSAPGS